MLDLGVRVKPRPENYDDGIQRFTEFVAKHFL